MEKQTERHPAWLSRCRGLLLSLQCTEGAIPHGLCASHDAVACAVQYVGVCPCHHDGQRSASRLLRPVCYAVFLTRYVFRGFDVSCPPQKPPQHATPRGARTHQPLRDPLPSPGSASLPRCSMVIHKLNDDDMR